MHDPFKQIDKKELQLPDTLFIRDIESKVFQSIIVQCLARIEGVETLEGNLFDNLLGHVDKVKGVHVEQDPKNHAVSVRVEINVSYGVCIPEKAEEIQGRIIEDIGRLTNLRVHSVHIIFKNLIAQKQEAFAKEYTERD